MSNFSKVKACLLALNYSSLSGDNFEDKLVIQKVVYLLKLKGIEFSYPFNLYVRGPYSPSLTRDIYGHKKELIDLRSNEELSPSEKKVIQEFIDVMELRPAQLEVAATYAYFAFERRLDAVSSTAHVRRMKGFYPEAQIALGISRAKQLLFRPTADQIASMKEEDGMWESASDSDQKD